MEKIIMSVGDRLIELTPDEAKQLREKLNAMFGQPQLPQAFPSVPWSPYPWEPVGDGPPYREFWTGNTKVEC